jgi:hypothetical protein
MSAVLALVATVQDLMDLQATFPEQADVGIVGESGGAVSVFNGESSLISDIRTAPQTLAAVDEHTLTSLGPTLDGLPIDPTQIFGVLTTIFGAGNEQVLDDEAQSTLAGYLLTFSPGAQATLDVAPSTEDEVTGLCVHTNAET